MQILIYYLESVILSISMDTIQDFRYYKDACDHHFKINQTRLNEVRNNFSIDCIGVYPFEYFIPLYNIVTVLLNTLKYSNIKDRMFAQLYTYKCLDKMSKKEIEEYEKNPSLIRAYMISSKREKQIKNTIPLTIHEDLKEDSTVYFDYKKGKYLIKKIDGPLENKDEEEQNEKFFDALEHSLNINIDELDKEGKKEEIEKLKLIREEMLAYKEKKLTKIKKMNRK